MRLSAEFQFLVLGILPHQHWLGCQKFPLVSPISVACVVHLIPTPRPLLYPVRGTEDSGALPAPSAETL